MQLPRLKIGFPAGSFNLQLLTDKNTHASLEALASEFFGQPTTLEIVKLSVSEPAAPSLAEEQQRQQLSRQEQLRANATEHPMIKAATRIFDGEVADIRPIDKGFT